MLSFELKEAPNDGTHDELEIYCDPDGLKSLMRQLEFLSDGRADHVHLMASSWGGHHLEDNALQKANIPIHHVRILLLSES